MTRIGHCLDRRGGDDVRAGHVVCAKQAHRRAAPTAPAPRNPPAARRTPSKGPAGLGTGRAKPPETLSGDAAINQENAILDRKLKSICRGC